MKTIQKKVLCLGLLAIMVAPLSGCGDTWQGVKNDWHNMTGSSDDNTAPQTAQAQPAMAQPAPAAQPQAAAPMQATAPAHTDSQYSFNK